MTFVILQAPGDGYYWMVKATSNKHFELLDSGFIEVQNGDYYDMLALIGYLETDNELIELKCSDTHSMIQTTQEMLNRILELNPDYLNNKSFV